jgi:hypothetical protein
MSRDRRGDGVQVVAGSNPACPTNSNHFRINKLAASSSHHPASVSSLSRVLFASTHNGSAFDSSTTYIAYDDDEFRWSPVR